MMYQFLPWEGPYGLHSYANISKDFYGTSVTGYNWLVFPCCKRCLSKLHLTERSYTAPVFRQTKQGLTLHFPVTYHNSANHCFPLKMLTYISLPMWPMFHKSNKLPTTNLASSIPFQFYYSCNFKPAFTGCKLPSFAVEFDNPASMLLWSVIIPFIKCFIYIQIYYSLVSP